MSNLYRRPPIDASYQVSLHLAKRFQRRRIFQKSANQKQEQPMVAMFVNGLGRNEQLHRGPSIDASYQVSDNLAKRFQRRFFRNRPIRIKNCLWWPCLLMDRDEMSNLYRRPPIDVSYQVSVHLVKRFQRRSIFRNQPIRNKSRLWRPCLLTDRDEMSNFTEDLPQMLPTKFRFIWPSGFRED